MKVTADRLRKLFNYDPETGLFSRLVAVGRHGCFRAGTLPGCIRRGYLWIDVDGERHSAHRLAWLYMTGDWPKDQIDHIDNDRQNNRFANLREATNAQNSQNEVKPRKNNKSGFLGVSPCGRRWRADIKIDGRTRLLGRFDTPEAAHQKYLKAKRELHPFGTLAA